MAELSAAERKNILKEANDRRSGAQKVRNHPRARWIQEQWALQILLDRQQPAGELGTVVSISRERCRVRQGGTDHDCTLVREIGEKQQQSLAPGDSVRFEPYGDGWRVTEVLPRRTSLSRTDPINRNLSRTVVANVDVVAIVVSVVAPPLHPRLIDRYLAGIYPGGAQPLLIVNKVDLCPDEATLREELAKVAHYESIMPVFIVSTSTGAGLDALRERLQDRLVAFVGHSGVGKSSLVTALVPGVVAEAGAVSEVTGRGMHTTTASTLIESDGMRIIDTPGIREFAVSFRSAEDVLEAFPDFHVAGRCRFPDCRHGQEADCAVRAGVREGVIPMPRFAMYRRLLQEVTGDSDEEPPDGFTCIGCGQWVNTEGGGTEHRNHCPRCLSSRHLDNRPGDRAAGCDGLMEPIAVWVRKGGEWAIVHRCRVCGKLGSNRIASDDNEALLLSLAVRPLSNPPFPLWAIGGEAAVNN